MTSLDGLVLGVVQGLTEFLPVSSSGHLVVVQALLGLREPELAFDVAVHGATLVAVLVWFRGRIAALVRNREWAYVGKLAAGSIPAGLVGIGLGDAVERAFAEPALVAALLAVTGAILLSLYFLPRTGSARQPGWSAAILIGCAQAAAILPGISRSGSTIVAGLWLGMAPAAAAEFSFLLGVPAIAGAVALQLPDLGRTAGGEAGALAVGAVSAFATGLVAIAVVFRVLATRGFRRFGFYCLTLGALLAVWLEVGA